MADDTRFVFHLAGDDHEERLIEAMSEGIARDLCADRFNDQYPCDCDGGEDNHTDDCSGGTYLGDEFELLGVYRIVGDAFIDGDDLDNYRDDLATVSAWP